MTYQRIRIGLGYKPLRVIQIFIVFLSLSLLFIDKNGSGSEVDIPDPDYDDTDPPSGGVSRSRIHSSPSKDSGSGLVVPKKLPNPVLESKERQDLHRELLMNQKM